MTRPRITCLTCGRALTPGGPACCPKPPTGRMTDHLDRAAEVIAAQMHGLTTPSMCREIAWALEGAGMLVTPERDVEVARTWEALAVSQFERNQAMREQMRRLYVESRDGMAVLDAEALVAELVRRGVLREERVGDNRVCRCTAHRSDPVLIAPCEAHEPITLPTRYVTEWEPVEEDA